MKQLALTLSAIAMLSSSSALAFDFLPVARANYKNVYCLHAITSVTTETEYSNQGTGSYVGPNLILTNFHVVRDSFKVEIYDTNGEYVGDATVIASDPKLDVALLVTKRTNKTHIQFAESDGCHIGDDVMMMGFPLNRPLRTDGLFDGWVIPGVQFAYSAQVDHGNSGGPVFNAEGQLIGIATLRLDNGEALAISAHAILEVLGVIPARLTIGVDIRNAVYEVSDGQ